MNFEDEALVAVGRGLQAQGYRFTPVSPLTHRRIETRPGSHEAATLRDVFGWCRPFDRRLLSSEWIDLLTQANVLEQEGTMYRSAVGYSTIGDGLFAHSAPPALSPDAVEMGADTVSFVALLRRSGIRAERAIDVGCGTGAGGLSMAAGVQQWVLADINPRALRFAKVNAALNGAQRVEYVHSDVLADVTGPVDLVIAHPPSLADSSAGPYREGGGPWGIDVSCRIVRESLQRLEPGGRLVLLASTPIHYGEDTLLQTIAPMLDACDATFEYLELDSDISREELDKPQFAQVDRIARVALSAMLR